MANWEQDPISEPQVDFIKGLVKDRDLSKLTQEQIDFLNPGNDDEQDANLHLMNKGQADIAIKALKACPNKPKPAPVVEPGFLAENIPVQGLSTEAAISPQTQHTGSQSAIDVRDGFYFIVEPGTGEERFFRVKHGKEGTKWADWIFVDIQASDFFYPIKDRNRKNEILAEIAKDPIRAMNEYGLRLGRCGVCNRTLTDRHSILRGIGPICAERLGPTGEQLTMLQKLGLIKD